MIASAAPNPLASPPAGLGLSAAVAADLERLFADAPALRKSGPDPEVREPRRRRARSRPAEGRSLRHAGVGALAGAVLVGLLAGLVLQRPAPKAAEAKATAPPTYAGVYPEGMPAAAPLRPPTALIQPVSVTAPPAQNAAPARKPRAAKGQACGRRCGYDQVLAADRRLRQTYDEAVRAGVPRAVLRDYRDDWSRARRRSSDDPRKLVARYADLRTELERQTARQLRRRAAERISMAER